MVYVLRFETRKKGFFKVGISTKISTRMSDLQTACPFKLSLVALRSGHRKEERALHKAMDKYRTSGEWFQDNDATREILDIPQIPLDTSKASPLNSLLYFMEINKKYSFDANLICELFKVDFYNLKNLYHRHGERSPVRIECVQSEDLERINFIGEIRDRYTDIISSSEFFNSQFGGYERFNSYHSRITPFNKHLIPKKWLEPKYPYTYFFQPDELTD